MRKSILILCALFTVFVSNAQTTTPGVRLTFGAAAKTYTGTVTIDANPGTQSPVTKFSYVIGSPFFGVTANLSGNTYSGSSSTYSYTSSRLFDIGFPWGELFINKTFSKDYFNSSKGYYSDRVAIDWRILNNSSSITSIVVYRTEDLNSQNPAWGNPIKLLTKDATSFDDITAEGGKIYKYKIKALGAVNGDPDIEFNTYIIGIGYRNPTGIITGQISFKGGNPVKDVLVSAVAEGDNGQLGNSLNIPSTGYVYIPQLTTPAKDSFTVQFWLNTANSTISNTTNLFTLTSNSGDNLSATAGFINNGAQFEINIGGVKYQLGGYIPSGKLNNKGEDLYDSIASFSNKFVNIAIAFKDGKLPLLYINGRPITSDYITYLNTQIPSSLPRATLNTSNGLSTLSVSTNDNGNKISWSTMTLGGGTDSYFDDLRIWGSALPTADIRASYRRYLRGNENTLINYLRFDESTGNEAYDLAFKGVTYYKSDAKFVNGNGSNLNWWSTNTPLRDQLGILGITDASGNYSIAAVPYKGNGEIIKVTPALGVHKFNPSQETVFIGTSTSVINRLNFSDESSFTFRGRALFDTRGVFPIDSNSNPVTGDIHDNEVYNAYTVGDLSYPKGEWWGVKGTGTDSNRIVSLRRYAPIAVDNAYIYVDNQIALDANSVPVVTDANGRFNIQVPIGKHSVSVKKQFHTFKFDGRYPAMDTVATYYDFFQDNDAEITYIDTTKVTVVGRVVGGQTELNKPIGFGYNGVYKVAQPVQGKSTPDSVIVSSINNIGTAQITLGYRQPNVTGSLQNAFKTTFKTNTATGEYRVNLLPLKYELNHSDVYIASQQLSTIKRFLTEDQILNFSEVAPLQTSSYSYVDSLNNNDTLATSNPFNYSKSFAYLATPQVSLLEQLTDSTVKVGDSTYKVASSFTTAIYSQLKSYSIKFQRQEQYSNYENAVGKQLFIVPATQGSLSITNANAFPGSESIVTDSTDKSKIIYNFTVGKANTDVTSGFRSTITANYILNGTQTGIPLKSPTAIILGGLKDGSQAFTTRGPDKIDFILRDPPGSGSYATIQKGSSLSLTTNNSFAFTSTSKVDFLFGFGAKFLTGIGIETETDATTENGFRVNINYGTTDGKQLNTTYSFNQSISTSASNDITGAAADVYVGNSTNYFYGTYDNIAVTETEKFNALNVSQSIPLATTNGTKYISKNKAIFFSPTGSATTFAYSQNYIITELIPTYETILNGLRNGTLHTGGTDNLQDSTWYKGSIDAWKHAIFRNEARKYLVYNELQRDSLKNVVRNDIYNQYSTGAVGASTNTTVGQHVIDMFNTTFYKNVSIDSKVGSYGESVEIDNTTTYVTSFSFGLGIGYLQDLETKLGANGFHMKVENENIATYNYNQQQDIKSSTIVSYVLADNDPYNTLSVDVINSFDGNGPIFIRRGGITSCPAEAADSTHYFMPYLLPAFQNELYSTDSLTFPDAGSKKVEISGGSIFVEQPVITVKNNTVYGVPETGKAQFVVTLRNASPLEPASTSFKLTVNPATNPNGAKFNISSQGVPINLNGSAAIQYTVFMEKGAPDVFDYENIELDFGSICDGNVNASVLISAHFIKSCTKVDQASPSDNWSVNYTTSYSNGATIPVPVVLNGYKTDYANFTRIALQYRMQGSPSWTTLNNYVADTATKSSLVAQGYDSTSIQLITGTEINYAWDVAGNGLSDGYYEMRAVSYCSNGTKYESTPITGKVDLHPPVLFGTPTPTDGILSIGQDIKIKFNEPVKTAGSLTRTEFVVQQNQLLVDHNVALSFAGATSTATILQPFLKAGNISVEFWLRNGTTTTTPATIISQPNSFSIATSATNMVFTVGTQSINADIFNDGAYHHYACTYDASSGKLTIIQDDGLLKTVAKGSNLFLDNNSSIVLGGSDFIGKIHELRIWNSVLSRETAVANMYSSLNGNEDGLLGDWPMSEGHGILAKDIARFKNISLQNVNWDIFPSKQSYSFDGSNYLTLTNASKSIFTSTMDGTVEFWFKTNATIPSTIISNGRGDSTDEVTTSGYRNKWSFDLDATGVLALHAENQTYTFGAQNLADGLWHHAAVVLRRKGNLVTYVDGLQTQTYPTQGLGGFSNNVLYVGARGQLINATPLSIDRNFNGQIDDIRVWNMAKPADQIAEDMYFEQDYTRTGLVLYAPLNSPDQASNNGPKYYYPINSIEKLSDYAVLSAGSSLAYSNITPPIKPIRNSNFIPVNPVINTDEVILNPSITDWASVEKKIAYITVANMSDMTDNLQQSPVTWTAYITKNPLKWYVEGYSNTLNIALTEKQTQTYQLVVANVGGAFQNFSISLPAWLKAQTKSGTIAPNSQLSITLSVDTTVSAGNYFDEIRLNSNYNYVEKIQTNLRVLRPEPNWNFNANNFEENMNVIGKVKVDGIFSNDPYDKLVAYYMDSVRGIASVQYDPALDEYFALLTIYGSSDAAGYPINFKIWDASAGVLKAAAYNGVSTIQFQPNYSSGNYRQPIIFTNSGFQTQIVKMNKGWSWLSFNVEDSSFKSLNTLFRTSQLTQGDVIKTSGPALFDVYNVSPIPGQTGWAGTISTNGGINASKMYKTKLAIAQNILATGLPVDLATKTFTLDTNWVGIPYIANRNLTINEGLAYLDAQDGDLLKSQSQFAIYDRVSKSWKGSLTSLTVGEGYMIKTSKPQVFRYPPYANLANQTASVPELPTFVNGIETNAISTLTAAITTEAPAVPSSSLKLDQHLLNYAENMNIVAAIPSDYNKVEFYNAQTNQIIGQAETVKVGDQNLIFGTIYGDTTVGIKAKLISDNQSAFATNSIYFKANDVLGSLATPIQLTASEKVVLELNAYPNPFMNDLTIEFTSDIDGTASLEIYNDQTRLIESKQITVSKGLNKYKYHSSKAAIGNYLVFKLEVGNRLYTKLILKH